VGRSIEANTGTSPTTLYTVFNMSTGLKGIYQDWKEASEVFNGVKGAKAKKFYTLEEAQDWLEVQQRSYDGEHQREHR
jgi:hypothetical protein